MSVTAVFSQSPSGDEEVHPVHREWMTSVADSIAHLEYLSLPSPLDKTFGNGVSQLFVGDLPESDVYLLEKPKHLYFLPKLKQKAPESTIVYLHATCRFLGAKRYPKSAWGKKWPVGVVERTMDGELLKQLVKRYVDGIITVSKPLERQLKSFSSAPTRIVHPFVPSERATKFANVDHSAKEKKITVLAENRPRKGVELVVDAWESMADDYDQYELHVAGRGQASRFGEAERVFVHGFIESLPEFFSSSGLHVHPAYCDPFPVSTIEAMMAGVPTIVSKYTGTRELTSNISPHLTVDTTKETIASAMRSVLDQSPEEKQKTRELSREVAKRYKKGTVETDFTTRFESLLTEVSD